MVQPLSSSELMQRAMSAATLRQKLLASNVANADTPGYKRFDLALRQAIEATPDRTLDQSVYRETGTSLRADGNNVDIEQEMASVAENSLYFESLSSSLGKQMATLRYLISEGRR